MYKSMHPSGSHITVYRNPEHYLDATQFIGNHTYIFLVRQGQVYHKEVVHNEKAPDRIVSLMRASLQPDRAVPLQ